MTDEQRRAFTREATESHEPAPDRPAPNAKGSIEMPSQQCVAFTRQGAACLEAWRASTALAFSHVYVPKRPIAQFVARAPRDDDCCAVLRAALAADPRYRLVYDGPGAAGYAR